MPITQYVVVSNIGVVYSGIHTRDAMVAYARYKRASLHGKGYGAGEDVTWYKDGVIHREHVGVVREER